MKFPETYRIDGARGFAGRFVFPTGLRVIASDGDGWDHVSVSLPDRTPTWDEMCGIKKLFFGDDQMAVQYHPAGKDYINQHPYCLHLWRPHGQEIQMPPRYMV